MKIIIQILITTIAIACVFASDNEDSFSPGPKLIGLIFLAPILICCCLCILICRCCCCRSSQTHVSMYYKEKKEIFNYKSE